MGPPNALPREKERRRRGEGWHKSILKNSVPSVSSFSLIVHRHTTCRVREEFSPVRTNTQPSLVHKRKEMTQEHKQIPFINLSDRKRAPTKTKRKNGLSYGTQGAHPLDGQETDGSMKYRMTPWVTRRECTKQKTRTELNWRIPVTTLLSDKISLQFLNHRILWNVIFSHTKTKKKLKRLRLPVTTKKSYFVK